MVLNTGVLDWESNTLTTRPLLHVWLSHSSKRKKNEQLPLSASFTAKRELAFVLIQENAFSERFLFEASRNSIDSTEISY